MVRARRAGAAARGTTPTPLHAIPEGATPSAASSASTTTQLGAQAAGGAAVAPEQLAKSERSSKVVVALLDMACSSSSSATAAAGALALEGRLAAAMSAGSERRRGPGARQRQLGPLHALMQAEGALPKVMARLGSPQPSTSQAGEEQMGEEQMGTARNEPAGCGPQLAAPLLRVAARLLALAREAAPQQLPQLLTQHLGGLVSKALQLLVPDQAASGSMAVQDDGDTHPSVQVLQAAYNACLSAAVQDPAWRVLAPHILSWLPLASQVLHHSRTAIARTGSGVAAAPETGSDDELDGNARATAVLQGAAETCKLLRLLLRLTLEGSDVSSRVREALGSTLADIVCCEPRAATGPPAEPAEAGDADSEASSAQVAMDLEEARLRTACLRLLGSLYSWSSNRQEQPPLSDGSRASGAVGSRAPRGTGPQLSWAQLTSQFGADESWVDLERLVRAVLRLAASPAATRAQACAALEALVGLCGLSPSVTQAGPVPSHQLGMLPDDGLAGQRSSSLVAYEGGCGVLGDPRTCVQLLAVMRRVQEEPHAAAGGAESDDEEEEALASLQLAQNAAGGANVSNVGAEVAAQSGGEGAKDAGAASVGKGLLDKLGLVCPVNPAHPLVKKIIAIRSSCNSCGCVGAFLMAHAGTLPLCLDHLRYGGTWRQ